MRAAITLVAAAGAAGCGLGWTGESSGGGANLPTLGAGPYGRLPADFDTPAAEPAVIASRFDDYADPACLAREGGGIRLWFGLSTDDDPPGVSAIGRAEVPSLHDLPDVAPLVAMVASEPWEEDRVAAPAVIARGRDLVMFYEGGIATPAIGMAISSDGGETWTREPDPVLTGAADPTVTFADDRFHLFVTRPGEDGVWRATSEDGLGFAFDPAPAITPRPDLAAAFDALGVGDPFVLIQTSDAGRQHWGLWFTGTAETPDAGDAPTAIGFAGSFDGIAWERFGGAEPVLTAPAAGPCVLLDAGTGTLLFDEVDRLHLRISAAVHP